MKTLYFETSYASPLGELTLESDGESLTALYFTDLPEEEDEDEEDADESFQKDAPGGTLADGHFKNTQHDKADAEEDEGDALPVFDQTRRWLDCYFSGRIPDFTPPLRPEGSPFCHRVWEILLTIPFGETITYGTIAKRIAQERGIPKMAAQAVGRAVGSNPIALIIPCHRVVGADGDLTGYAGGLSRKAWLLDLEQSAGMI